MTISLMPVLQAGIIAPAPCDQVIDRNPARPLRHQDQEAGRPGAMCRPGIGIDEDLDHQRHDQQRQRGEAGGEPDHQQDWKNMLRNRGSIGREGRI